MCPKLNENETIQMIRKKFGYGCELDNFEILEDYYKLSLLCPLTKQRLELPARGTNCQHLECFDLRSYLSLTYDSILTNCPICKSYFVKSTLRIDKFVLNILSDMNSKSLSEVNIDETGKWTRIGEARKKMQTLEGTILIDSDAGDETIVISDDDDVDQHPNDQNRVLTVLQSIKKETAITNKSIGEEISKNIMASIEKDISQIRELLIANVIMSGKKSAKKAVSKAKRALIKPEPILKRVPRKNIVKPEPIIPEESIKHRLRARKSLNKLI